MTTLDAKTLRHLLASWQPADALVAADMVEEFGPPAAALLTARRYEGVRDARALRTLARLQAGLCEVLLRQNRAWVSWWEGAPSAMSWAEGDEPNDYAELLLNEDVEFGGRNFRIESIGSPHEMSVEVLLTDVNALLETVARAWLQRRLIDDGTGRRSYIQRRAWGLARDVRAWAGGAEQ